jgi:hypothetical protein
MATAPRGQLHQSLRSFVLARNAEGHKEDPAAAHARQLKEQQSQSHNEGT